MNQQITDDELMSQYKNGKQQALHQLYHRYHEIILSYARKLSAGKLDIAEDVAQSTWLKIAEKASSYQAEGHFVAWVYTITRNIFINEVRKLRRLEFCDFDVKTNRNQMNDLNLPEEVSQANFMSVDKSPEEQLVECNLRQKLWLLIGMLPSLQRMLLTVWIESEASYDDLSVIFNIPSFSVKSLLFRARQTVITAV